MNLEQILARMAEIAQLIDAASGDELRRLHSELNDLEAQRKRIEQEAALRNQMRGLVASGAIAGREIEAASCTPSNYGVDTVEYRNAYMANLQGKTLTAEQRTAVSSSGAIPTMTMNKIVGKLKESPLLAAINLLNIPGNVTFPVEGTVNNASWVAMGTAATDSADTVTTVSLGAYKLIKTVEITADVQSMSIDAFEDWLVARLANKIEAALDAAICTGDGTNKASGILKTDAVTNTGVYTKTKMAFSDLTKIISSLPTQYLPGASFLMPRALFYGKVLGMTDTTGNRVVVADAQSPAKFNILGYPVIVDDNVTAGTIIFGNLRDGYTLNLAKAPEIRRDDSVGFRTGSSVYRAMALADGKVVDKNALCVFTESAT